MPSIVFGIVSSKVSTISVNSPFLYFSHLPSTFRLTFLDTGKLPLIFILFLFPTKSGISSAPLTTAHEQIEKPSLEKTS